MSRLFAHSNKLFVQDVGGEGGGGSLNSREEVLFL